MGGYLLGTWMLSFFDDMARVQKYILIGLAVLALIPLIKFAVTHLRVKKQEKPMR